ncbi:hypothetical protein OIU76_021363, partial [Salix suchowensis]
MQSSFYDILQNGILKLKIYIVVSTLNQVWPVPLTNANGWSSKDIRFGECHRSNNYSRRSNRLNAKEALLCNISSYVDHLFQ